MPGLYNGTFNVGRNGMKRKRRKYYAEVRRQLVAMSGGARVPKLKRPVPIKP